MTFHINEADAAVTMHKTSGTGPYTYEVLVADFGQKDILVYLWKNDDSDIERYMNMLRTFTNSSAKSYTYAGIRMPNYPNNN